MPRPLVVSMLVCVLASSACFGTSYVPHIPGKDQVVLTYSSIGSTRILKNGKEVASGYFDKSVVEVFSDNAEAKEHADTWRQRKLWSLATSIIGSIITLVGVFTIDPGAGLSGRNAVSVASIITGSAPLQLASVLTNLSADSHLQDAINRYNDGVRKRDQAGGAKVSVSASGLRITW